jgi:hypothetical protein
MPTAPRLLRHKVTMTPTLLSTRTRALALCAALTVLASAASCTDKSAGKLSKSTGDSITAALSKLGDTSAAPHSSGHKYGPPTGKIRIANLLEIDGHPSGPLDFYDVRKPDSTTEPLIKGLKYGEISDYVSPRGGDNFAGSPSWLYLFAAGLKQATKPFGGNIENGFDATDQLTIALGPSKGFSGAASIALVTIVEGGKKIDAAHADSETALQGSQALLIVRDANGNVDSLPEQYLMIDGACPHAANDTRVVGDKLAFSKEPSSVSTTLFFPIAPGAHTLGVVTSPRGKGLLTCAGHTPGATTPLSVEAGRRYAVWVFGQSSDGLKVVAARIATP